MIIRLLTVLSLALTLGVTGCSRDADSPDGFKLPDGNATNGRAVFVYMQCHQCHTVAGDEFPDLPGLEPPYVELGGTTSRVKTYAELVTAIINPSHELAKGYATEQVSEDGESKMYIYNSYMTVAELTDLVMFLQPQYDVIVPKYHYRVYPY
jgi:sulfur-oxidizing protein SoxX